MVRNEKKRSLEQPVQYTLNAMILNTNVNMVEKKSFIDPPIGEM